MSLLSSIVTTISCVVAKMLESDFISIQRLLSDFAWHADRGDGAALSELFQPEGVLWVGGVELKGREQIAQDCRRRALDPHRKTRHLWSNLRVLTEHGNVATATAIQSTYEQKGADGATQLRVNDIFDKYEREPQGAWLFVSRTIERQISLVMPAKE